MTHLSLTKMVSFIIFSVITKLCKKADVALNYIICTIRNQTTCQLASHFTMKNFFLRKWSQLSRCGDCLSEISSMILKDSHEQCLINYWEMVVCMDVWLKLKSVWSLPQTKDQFLSSAELCIVFRLHWLILDVPWITEAK